MMKGFIAAALATVATLSEAASIGLQMQQANFDNIDITVPVASLQPIGTHRGLTWDGFNVIDDSLAPVGVAAQSNPNVAVQYLLSTGLSPTAILRPASSKITYFSLQSF